MKIAIYHIMDRRGATQNIKAAYEAISIETEFGRFGVLICADCLKDDVVERTTRKNDLVFLPISLTDPNHPRGRVGLFTLIHRKWLSKSFKSKVKVPSFSFPSMCLATIVKCFL